MGVLDKVREDIQKIKNSVDLLEFAETELGLEFKESGAHYKASCPFHADGETPNLTIKKGDQKFYCYSCEAKGDVIDLSSKVWGIEANDTRKKIAQIKGITLSKKKDKKKNSGPSELWEIRNEIQEFSHNLLLNDADALKYLSNRGIELKHVKEWKIAISKGTIFSYFKKKYSEEMLRMIGVSDKSKKNDKYYNFIKENVIMYPVYENRKISHWALSYSYRKKSIKDTAKEEKYQIYNECRVSLDAFFNSKIIEGEHAEDDFYIVEGPEDCIQMEIAGYPTIATLGNPSSKQAERLLKLVEFSDHFPDDLAKIKTINICYDRDGNKSGQKRSIRLAAQLSTIHKVKIWEFPDKEDPDSYLRKYKNLSKIEARFYNEEKSPIHEKDDKYFFDTSKGPKQISNFVIKLKYVIQDEIGFKSYMITFKSYGEEYGPYPFTSRDWKSDGSFIEYIGKCNGQFSFNGRMKEILAVKDYLFKTYSPKTIRIVDGYGNISDDLWVADNAVIWKGEIRWADSDCISWIDDRVFDVQGIRTNTCNDTKQLRIPKKYWDIKTIIKNLNILYKEPKMIWPMIGFATASIYFKKIALKMGQFPVVFCYGEFSEGKTGWAEICASLTGALFKAPSGESTVKGIHRDLSRNYSLPMVLNDFRGASKEAMVCSLFDLDPYVIGLKSTDKRTLKIGYNSPAILTSTKSMQREDALSRCIIINFNNWEKDDNLVGDFEEFYTEGIEDGRNIGFLIDMLNTDAEDHILDNIRYTEKNLAKQSADEKIEARQIQVFGVLFGAFLTACDALNLWDLFDELGMEIPDAKSLAVSFGDLSLATSRLMKEQEEISKFFSYIESLNQRDKIDTIFRGGYDTDGKEYIVFHLGSIIGEVQKEDRMTGTNKLQGLPYGWFKDRIETLFKAENKPTAIDGKSTRGYKIYLNDLEENGIHFTLSERLYGPEKNEEEESIFRKEKTSEPPF